MRENARNARNIRTRNPRVLSDVLERRIALYVLAAGATVATVSPTTQAGVVFTPSHAEVTIHGPDLQIDINNDGVADVIILGTSFLTWSRSTYRSFPIWTQEILAKGAVPANKFVDYTFLPVPVPLKAGARIGSSGNFQTGGLLSGGNAFAHGFFRNTTNRYLGVRFVIGGDVHYAWVGFRSVGNGTAVLLGWAYETEPNTPLIAGDWLGAVFPPAAQMRISTPTNLELLARGHDAVADWRRRTAAIFSKTQS